jgi:hypothetical protein
MRFDEAGRVVHPIFTEVGYGCPKRCTFRESDFHDSLIVFGRRSRQKQLYESNEDALFRCPYHGDIDASGERCDFAVAKPAKVTAHALETAAIAIYAHVREDYGFME